MSMTFMTGFFVGAFGATCAWLIAFMIVMAMVKHGTLRRAEKK